MLQIQVQDRPREKLQAKGTAALSDFELFLSSTVSDVKQP